MALQPVSGLSEVARNYKALLLDQFGVLHDGRRPYPGAVAAVEAAAAAGLRQLLISNSSRRSAGTLDKLANMGFPRDAFMGVVTSGELTHRYLSTRPDAWWSSQGSTCLHINWAARGPIDVEGGGYGLQVVRDPHAADLIVAHGTEGLSLPGAGGAGGVRVEELSTDELVAVLQGLAATQRPGGRGPPVMVVANPDLVTVDGDELVTMPGTLAAAYEAAGGTCVRMGKPAPLIYAACAEVLGLAPHELLAVGDSLEHDIGGANAAGIDSLFIGSGIHAKDLLGAQQQQQTMGGDGSGRVDQGALEALCARYGGVRPTYVATSFAW